MKNRWFVILAAALLSAGCGVEYLDPDFDAVEVQSEQGGILPQGGTLLELPYAYVPATKFQPGREIRYFRFRAKLDGMPYAYGEVRADGSGRIAIPIPANDGYDRRRVSVETAVATEYESELWGDWEPAYGGTQECLSPGVSRRYGGLLEKRLRVTLGNLTAVFDFADNPSAVELKRLLSEGPLSFEVNVYQNYISSVFGDAVQERLLRRVPLNEDCGKERMRGDLFMTSLGQLEFFNEAESDWTGKTRLGRVTEGSLTDFSAMCIGLERQDMTLSLTD